MIYLLIATLLWSFSFGLIKYNLAGIDPYFISFARLFLSMLLFIPFYRKINFERKISFLLFVNGAVQFGFMYEAYVLSFNFLKAHEVALFTILTPVYVTLYYDFLNKNLNIRFFLLAILSVFGAGIIVYSRLSSSNLWIGFLLVQFANICFAVGQINYKRIKTRIQEINDNAAMLIMYSGATAVSIVFAATMIRTVNLNFTFSQILVMLYLGIIASGIGFFLWNYGVTKVSSGILSTFNNLKIPFGITISLFFFNETVNLLRFLSGSLIIISAIILSNKSGEEHVKN